MKEGLKMEEVKEEGVVLPLSLIELGNESPLNLDHVNGISFSPLTDTLTRSASRLPPQPEASMDAKTQTCYCSSPRDPRNKENHHTEPGNILDIPVVIEEPLQTRKRKKDRGCNLRKSLAWNKAFFTEEGVLDPLELSILSGSVSKSSKGFMSQINAGEPAPSPGSYRRGDRSVLQAFEDNLFKEMPARFQNENQNLNGLFSKLESSMREDPPLPPSSRKAQLTKGSNRSMPQDSSHLSVASKCVVQPGKRSKCTQNAPPVIPVKNASSKGPSSCTRKDLSCVPAKSSVPCPGKHKANLPSETHLSVNQQTPQVVTTIDTSNLKVIQEQLLQVDMHASTSHIDSKEDTVRLPQHVQPINGNVPSAQYHSKPSGLRMPSPSLGYFCQGKVSASRSFLPDKNKPCNHSEIKNSTVRKPCEFNHIGELKPLSIPYSRPPRMSIDAPTIGVAGAVTAISQVSSRLKRPVSPMATAKPNSELNTLRKDGPEDSSESWSQKSHSYHFGYSHGVNEQSGKQASLMSDPDETKQVPNKENHKLQMEGDSLLAEIASFEQPQPQKVGFEHASDDSNASVDTSGIELVNSHSLSQVSCGEHLSQHVPQLNNVDKNPQPFVINECQRSSHGHWPVEICGYVPDTLSVEMKNNIEQGLSEEAESSLGLGKEQVADVGTAKSLELVGSSAENIASSRQGVSQSCGSITLDRDNGLESSPFSEETITALSETGRQPDTGLQSQLKDSLSTKDEPAAIANKKKHVDDDSTQGRTSMDYRVNAVPFSDEWVAALEAAGEDILTMKTGAVQNSPPDKTIPEPGPYSPVKRNTQDIGPFHCTKYTTLASDIH
ncbi:hypothetical protein AAC387_Pa09g1819 [Persea americana]